MGSGGDLRARPAVGSPPLPRADGCGRSAAIRVPTKSSIVTRATRACLERLTLVVQLRIPQHVREQTERRSCRIEPELRDELLSSWLAASAASGVTHAQSPFRAAFCKIAREHPRPVSASRSVPYLGGLVEQRWWYVFRGYRSRSCRGTRAPVTTRTPRRGRPRRAPPGERRRRDGRRGLGPELSIERSATRAATSAPAA